MNVSEFAPVQRKGQGQPKGFQGRSEGQRSGQGAGPIHTVREEPDMPDSQVIVRKLCSALIKVRLCFQTLYIGVSSV